MKATALLGRWRNRQNKERATTNSHGGQQMEIIGPSYPQPPPSEIFRPFLSRHGQSEDGWVAWYPNGRENTYHDTHPWIGGVYAHGRTPKEAMQAFDWCWEHGRSGLDWGEIKTMPPVEGE